MATSLKEFEGADLVPLDPDEAPEAGQLLGAILTELETLTEAASGALAALLPQYTLANGNRLQGIHLRRAAAAMRDVSMRLYWAGVDAERFDTHIQDVRPAAELRS